MRNFQLQYTFHFLRINLECIQFFVFGREDFFQQSKELLTQFGFSSTEKNKNSN